MGGEAHANYTKSFTGKSLTKSFNCCYPRGCLRFHPPRATVRFSMAGFPWSLSCCLVGSYCTTKQHQLFCAARIGKSCIASARGKSGKCDSSFLSYLDLCLGAKRTVKRVKRVKRTSFPSRYTQSVSYNGRAGCIKVASPLGSLLPCSTNAQDFKVPISHLEGSCVWDDWDTPPTHSFRNVQTARYASFVQSAFDQFIPGQIPEISTRIPQGPQDVNLMWPTQCHKPIIWEVYITQDDWKLSRNVIFEVPPKWAWSHHPFMVILGWLMIGFTMNHHRKINKPSQLVARLWFVKLSELTSRKTM